MATPLMLLPRAGPSQACRDRALALTNQGDDGHEVSSPQGDTLFLTMTMMSPQNNNRAAWLQGPPSQCAELPSDSAQPWRLVLLGAPGIGKGTQADVLHRKLKCCHLSTGDVFRAAVKGGDCDQSPAMKAAMEYMRRGDLVPDATVWEMVRERSACLRCRGGFVLDGFPRTLAQAEALKELLETEKIPLNAVVNYELPLEQVIERLAGRRTCRECKSVYHVTRQPSKTPGICDRCGGTLYQRDDDRPESIKVRMETYQRSTMPLIEFYTNLGLLVSIAASGSPEEIYDRTMAALKARTNGTGTLIG